VEVNDTQSAKQFLGENRAWQSELASWQTDLMFNLRMLDIYGLKSDSAVIAETMDNLKSMVDDFQTIRLDRVRSQLKTNEAILNRLVSDELLLKDREMPFRQQDDDKEVCAARVGFHSLQKQMYTLIEQLKAL